ncbi:copper homeostasis protein CutC [Tenacibaculum amylolyticum]|uniref:copper homeostasis protein CutC n=1 Tax=Tenacibaculum amylolyticum TaxID=104269 RepID=UPI0038944EE4
MKLEICTNSYLSALNAQEAGAHRIELCSELSLGGITPSYGLLKKITQDLTIETFVLIRPRSGDFVYTNDEFEIMKQNILLCKELGVHGIVSGVLHSNNTIDIRRTKELFELAKPLSFTFHRAFDLVNDPYEAVTQLINLGVERVLTSGQANTAEKGLALLHELQKSFGNKITIMAGSGITPLNAHLFKEIGLTEIHSSASKKIDTNNADSNYFGTSIQIYSDKTIIKEFISTIN